MSNLLYAILFCVGLVFVTGFMQESDLEHQIAQAREAELVKPKYSYANHVNRDAFEQLVMQGNSLGSVAYAEVK